MQLNLRRGFWPESKGRGDAHDQKHCQEYGNSGSTPILHDGFHPFFQKVAAQAAKAGEKPASLFLQCQQGQRIGGPVLPPHPTDDSGIKGKLQVPVSQPVEKPDQRIKPMQRQHSGKKQFDQRVPAPYMDPLVGQYKLQCRRIPAVQGLRQENYGPENAIGQRRGDLIGTADANAPRQPMLRQPRLHFRRMLRQRSLESPQATDIGYRKIGREQNNANQP